MGPVRGNGHRGLVSDINVTPLVDVMLVLLIIFMITAPMMTQGLNVDLPKTTAQPLRTKDEPPLVVSIKPDGVIALGTTELDKGPPAEKQLFQRLSKNNDEIKKNPIYLQADKNVNYGTVVSVMDVIKKAGFDKLGMVTDQLEKEK